MSREIARRDLPAIAEQVRREHAAFERAARSAVEHAIKAGGLLIEAKAQLPHGEWGSWLRDNFPASERTAQAYMQLAREPQRTADLGSIKSALAELADPREPEPDAADGDGEVADGEVGGEDEAEFAEVVHGELIDENDPAVRRLEVDRARREGLTILVVLVTATVNLEEAARLAEGLPGDELWSREGLARLHRYIGRLRNAAGRVQDATDRLGEALGEDR